MCSLRILLAAGCKVAVHTHKESGRFRTFFMQDPFGNIFEIVEDHNWFTRNSNLTGFVCGVTIGVSSKKILCLSITIYWVIQIFCIKVLEVLMIERNSLEDNIILKESYSGISGHLLVLLVNY